MFSYGENNKVDISKLEIEDILLIKEYFLNLVNRSRFNIRLRPTRHIFD